MKANTATFLLAAAVLAGTAGASPARAEATAGEVLGWCDGASQPGQLGTINALRCVNYLQGAAEMVQALSGTDVGACLGPSVGTQLMARFVPELREEAAAGSSEPVAQQVAQWLEAACATVPTAAAEDAESEAQAEALRAELAAALEALDAAKREAQTAIGEASRLRSALNRASEDQDQLAACTASLDQLAEDLQTAEAAAAENGMRVSELELELQGVEAEAMARRQEISASADQIAALSAQFDATLEAKQREIEAAERRIAALAATLDEALTQRAASELALSEARQELASVFEGAAVDSASGPMADRLLAAETELSAANERIAALDAALVNSRGYARQLEDELQNALQASVEHTAVISTLESDLAACATGSVRADAAAAVPPPAMTPDREPAPPTRIAEAPPAPPSPAPSFNRLDVPRTGSNISNGNARIPGSGGANLSIAVQPRQLNTLGLMALRQTQQLALHQNVVGQRREWASPGGDYTGFVEILREGYQYGDFCREILSVARSGGAEVHREPERYCRSGDLWVFRR